MYKKKQTNSVALSPRANYTDWSTACYMYTNCKFLKRIFNISFVWISRRCRILILQKRNSYFIIKSHKLPILRQIFPHECQKFSLIKQLLLPLLSRMAVPTVRKPSAVWKIDKLLTKNWHVTVSFTRAHFFCSWSLCAFFFHLWLSLPAWCTCPLAHRILGGPILGEILIRDLPSSICCTRWTLCEEPLRRPCYHCCKFCVRDVALIYYAQQAVETFVDNPSIGQSVLPALAWLSEPAPFLRNWPRHQASLALSRLPDSEGGIGESLSLGRQCYSGWKLIYSSFYRKQSEGSGIL
jgi:hypothetical protein